MVTVVVLEFGVMRCQPLRRALGHCAHIRIRIIWKKDIKFLSVLHTKI